ncbi:MAG: Ig-like domain repeat protein [Candidatus Acidiferrales bacterium]
MAVWPASSSAQQTPKPALITQPVEESKLTVLRGNTYPLALAKYDRGAAPASLPMQRMLLVLKRSAEQEAALDTLLDQQQDKSSPNYHAWLTPEQFGQQFGPADQDIQTVTAWLQLQGFQIARVSNGRTVIEFSGTAAQVQSAFHTEIHKYAVNNEDHWANASDPQIPTALVPAIAGVLTLHNFPRHAMNQVVGVFKRSKDTSALTPVAPLFTLPNFSQGATFYGVGPFDFAKIYNVSPVWNASPPVVGTGQTIAVVGETDVDFVDLQKFRALFGITSTDPVFIVDGPDPGLQSDEIESDLDLEWSSAIAPGATIDFVVAATTDTTLGVDLAAQYIVDHNLAPIVSESYGICEAALGTAGNQFFNQLWQQAAAQGMSVFLASGDSGSAGCDRDDPARFGLQVSGFASTPYTTAVGGTDFNDLSNPTTYFNSTNDAHFASAKSYIPEMTWNDSCTNAEWSIVTGSSVAETNCNNPNLSFAVAATGGSGGKSSCTTGDGQDIVSCSGGYPKPSWQTGTGVPNDSKRDIPDVSLFASNGFNGSFYVICSKNAGSGLYCDPNNPNSTIVGIGGTSASAPSFAGIMALIDQKTNSRQGNPNYLLYKLAAQQAVNGCNSSTPPGSSCVFNDVTNGTIAMPCFTGSTTDCHTNNNQDQFGILTGYGTNPGYDRATGSLVDLPGGTYTVTAHYPGDATFGASDSTAVSVKVTPEASKATIAYELFDPNTGNLTNPNATSAAFGVAPSLLRINVTSHAGDACAGNTQGATGCPTGTVTLTDNTKPLDGGTFGLNSNGYAEDQLIDLPGGVHNLKITYAGDSSYSAPSPVTDVLTITPVATAVTAETGQTTFVNGSVLLGAGFIVENIYSDILPTGTITWSIGSTVIGSSPVSGEFIASHRVDSGANLSSPPNVFKQGTNTFTVKYSGDASYAASTGTGTITAFFLTTTTLISSNTTIQAGQSVTFTASIVTTPSGGAPVTGTVQFLLDGSNLGAPVAVQGGQAALTTSSLPSGIHGIIARYSGDGNNNQSGSDPLLVTINSLSSMTSVVPSSTSGQQGQVITFTVTVTPVQQGGPVPTGMLSIQVNGSSAGIGAPNLDATGKSSFASQNLPVGVDTILVSYKGDTAYTSSSGSATVTITAAPDFSVAANPASITIAKPGQSGSTSLTLTAMNGLTGTFSIVPQCTGLPSESSCSVSPTSVTFSSSAMSANVMLTVATTAPSSATPTTRARPTGLGWNAVIAMSILALLSALALLRRRRMLQAAFAVAVFATLLTFAACGGGGGGGNPGGGGGNPGTPVGLDSNARVSFTIGSTSHSVALSVNVQ